MTIGEMLMATHQTLVLARERNTDFLIIPDDVSLLHFENMYIQMQSMRDAGKVGRWLGYIQGALVAMGVGTLEEMKDINRNAKGLDDQNDSP